MPTARGTFEVRSWDEETYEELDDGRKLTRATVQQRFSGDIDGDGSVVWLMSYRPDGTAHYVGLQRVTGTVDGRQGTFTMESTGDFDGSEATGRLFIIAGSGTGQLSGIQGRGTGRAPHGSTAMYEIDVELD